MAPPRDDDPTVKELLEGGSVPLDPATQAELERWFGLPSVTQLEEEGKQAGPVDVEMVAAIERRDKALANVDPALLGRLTARADQFSEHPGSFEATIDVVIDDRVAFFDETMVDRALQIAEPRELELPDELRDDLKECTPQALLRDLHRAETDFEKTFEIIDAAAERLDIVDEVKSAMRTSWKLPAFEKSAVRESRTLLADVRAQRRQQWTEFLPQLPNRRVQE